MGGFGWHNPYPLEYGGGPTDIESVYTALLNAVGAYPGGGAAEDEENTIDGAWRQARALGLGILGTFAERAAMQVFPDIATDHLEVYEELLGIVPGGTEQERREAVATKFVELLGAAIPDIRTYLQALDGRLDVVDVPVDTATITWMGKAFEPHSGTPDYGPAKATEWPAYSDFDRLIVLLDNGGVAPSVADQRLIETVKVYLNNVLPAWMTFSILTSITGFLLDQSPLDVTGFGT
jgi:hypothetical protein